VDPNDRGDDRHPERRVGPLARSRLLPVSIRRRQELVSELWAHAAELVQQAGADQERSAAPAAVTAATAGTPLQIMCPRRSSGPAAVTAMTPKNGLEITAAVCAFSVTVAVTQRHAVDRNQLEQPSIQHQLDRSAGGRWPAGQDPCRPASRDGTRTSCRDWRAECGMCERSRYSVTCINMRATRAAVAKASLAPTVRTNASPILHLRIEEGQLVEAPEP
jgi:hypothetical protein